MKRLYVNLVTRNWESGIYALRRLNPDVHLFYQSRNDAKEVAEINTMDSAADDSIKMKSAADANNKTKRSSPRMHSLRPLPKPIAKFDPSPSGLWINDGLEWFELLGPRRSESRVVNANVAGDTVLYDADEGIILNLPSLHEPKGTNPVCLSITHPDAEEDALYVMDRYPGRALARRNTGGPGMHSCFEVLECRPSSRFLDDSMKGWGWRPLPPPPFIYEHGYEPTRIMSYTVVGDGTTLCISSDRNGIGTYCFDTVRADDTHRLGWDYRDEWRHVGNWALPFYDKAEYVPEFKLWFGFSPPRPNHLCAVDLSTMDHGQPPIVHHVWEDLDQPEEEDWVPTHFRILNLGSGKFCVAKIISAEATGMKFSVLTGIEMVHDKDDQSLRMFKHKSKRYMFSTPDVIHWVI
ncbi:unnamed protein product [Triticum turgidum subsp. durum]|uniref:Uncharacterized protein n=1 Tax=Triticum turgidum subsp. durum TaxID=4567 RepID=A0A9R0W9J0_TRITD|nr:unnamed protein product [Triticum turgidum subsp. durum]